MPEKSYEGWAKAKLEALHEDILEIKTDVKVQNGRIDKLENYRWFLTGAVIGVPFLVNWLLRVLSKGA